MEEIPDDLILEIFKFFPPKILATQLALVSHRWNTLAFTPSLWVQIDVLVRDLERFETLINPTLTIVSSGLKKLNLKVWPKFPVLPTVILNITQLTNLTELHLSYNLEAISAETLLLLTIKCPSVQVACLSTITQVMFRYTREIDNNPI